MRERDIERELVRRVTDVGGIVRKVQWIGHRGAPDRLVLLPPLEHYNSKIIKIIPQLYFPELKAPGEKPEPHQKREHDRLRAFGLNVPIIDSFDDIDRLMMGAV
jgi:hypothetical protein